jgi:hypothetical protein
MAGAGRDVLGHLLRLDGALGLDAIGIQAWLTDLEPVWIAHAIQALLHFLLFVPLVYLTALVITALFGMPALIRVVAGRDYPQLRREAAAAWSAACGMRGSRWCCLLPCGWSPCRCG